MKYAFYGISFIVGILAIFFGYQIKFKRKTSLINDYEMKNIKDEEGYTNWIGTTELAIGLLMIILSVVGVWGDKPIIVGIGDGILIITMIVLLINGDRKYRG